MKSLGILKKMWKWEMLNMQTIYLKLSEPKIPGLYIQAIMANQTVNLFMINILNKPGIIPHKYTDVIKLLLSNVLSGSI